MTMPLNAHLPITREMLLNDFAVRSFRDIADEDYIGARMAYRAGLAYLPLWQSQQTIEKYLKCILLLNRIPATKVRHDLMAAIQLIEDSGKLSLDLKPISWEFLRRIDEVGQYRYFEVSTSTVSRDVIQLDRLVWELRRFCTLDPAPRQLILEQGKLAPRYQLWGGHLEAILSSKENPARVALLVGNGFIGGSRRKKIKVRSQISMRNAPLYMHPELLEDVCHYVFLPPALEKAWRLHKAPDYEVPPDL